MFGALEFYIKARRAGVKPIIGIEAYIAPVSRLDRQKCSIKDASYHLLLLAENHTGYKNLIKLSSIGYTEGFYYRPRIDKQILSELNDGLICTSACLGGEISTLLARGDEKAAVAAAESFAKIFGEEQSKAFKECYGINYQIIRPSSVYGGEDGTGRLFDKWIRNAKDGEDLVIFGDDKKTLRCPVCSAWITGKKRKKRKK